MRTPGDLRSRSPVRDCEAPRGSRRAPGFPKIMETTMRPRSLAPALLALGVASTPLLSAGPLEAQDAGDGDLHGSTEWLASSAVLALPPELREGAEVRVRSDGAGLRTIREGSNGMICLGDEPGDGFRVACYPESLEPFMRLGRELAAEGYEGMERQRRRWDAVEAGEISMPEDPAMVYNLGFETESLNPDTVDWRKGSRLHALYTPYATPAETGLPTEGSRSEPWLMFPGKPSAHVMIFLPPRTGDGGG